MDSSACLNFSSSRSGGDSGCLEQDSDAAALEDTRFAVVCVCALSSLAGTALGAALCFIIVVKNRACGMKPTDVYVLNITVADLLQCGVYIPSVIAGNVAQRDIYGKSACSLLFWLTVTSMGVALLCHSALSVHLMLLTFSRDMKLMSRRGVMVGWLVATASWVIVGAISYGTAAQAGFVGAPNYHCGHEGLNAYMYVYFAVTLAPSQLLIPVAYAITYARIACFRKTLPRPSGGQDTYGLTSDSKKELRIFKTLVAMFALFEVLYVSSFLIRCASQNIYVKSVGNCLLYLSSVANGPLMLAVNSDYRHAARDILQRRLDLPSLTE